MLKCAFRCAKMHELMVCACFSSIFVSGRSQLERTNCCAGGLAIVPVSISYDFPLEEAGLLQELLGQRKKRESVFQFVSAFGKLVARVLWAVLSGGLRRPLGAGGTRGRVAIGFAHPIPIRKFLKDRVRRRKKRGTVTRSKPDLLHVSSSGVARI